MAKKVTVSNLLGDPVLFQEFSQDLKVGAVAAIPTDTLYGLAVDAASELGVSRIYRIKRREGHKPLILFLNSITRLKEIGVFPNENVRNLLSQHWPGQLTGIFHYQKGILKAFTNPTIGIRIPNHQELLMILEKYSGYLLTTSANISGSPPICDPETLESEMGFEIHWIVDGGKIPLSQPSTVADMTIWPPKVVRQGKLRL